MPVAVSRAHAGAALALLTAVFVGAGHAQQPTVTGEELYVDRLGCWNCHGKSGGGGAGPRIAGTRLPLNRFVSQLRMPTGAMPRFAPILASDAELANLYRWLDGAESFVVPLTMTVTLDAAPSAGTGSTEVGVIADVVDARFTPDGVRYGVLLLGAAANAPVASQALEYRMGARRWRKTTTDANGEAVLGPGADPVRSAGSQALTARLRMVLPPTGPYSLVVTATRRTSKAAAFAVVGIGSVVLNVE